MPSAWSRQCYLPFKLLGETSFPLQLCSALSKQQLEIRLLCLWEESFYLCIYIFGWHRDTLYIFFQEYEEPVYSYSTYPDRRYSSSTSQHLKCLHHSPVAKGYRLVVIASRAMVCKTPTYYLILYPLASARGCVILRSHILFFLLFILLISHHIQP